MIPRSSPCTPACRRFAWFLVGVPAVIAGCSRGDLPLGQPAPARPLRAVLVEPAAVTDAELNRLPGDGFNAVVLLLASAGVGPGARSAAERVTGSGLDLYYWIEVARNRELADTHPEWMGSVQGHPEWRRRFPSAPEPEEGQVVKTYPWVPILYEGAYEAQLARVVRLLSDLPVARGVFLNDLQGVPSSCGCGHPLCRWTTDYGPIRTAKRLDDGAASRFLDAVAAAVPGSAVIPVWTTECEEHDGAEDGACAGVGCYRGACWKEYAKQLRAVIENRRRLGVLLTYKELDRDLPVYGKPAGWITWALESFRELPPDGSVRLPGDISLVAVLQGWDVTEEEIATQLERVREAGTESWVITRARVDQSWTPALHTPSPARSAAR